MVWMLVIMVFPVLGIELFYLFPVAVALPVYLVVTALSIVYHRAMMQSSRQRVTTGRRGMVGRDAEVLSWEGESGEVRCHAEYWGARSMDGHSLEKGDRVRVVACDDLTLTVRGLDLEESPSQSKSAGEADGLSRKGAHDEEDRDHSS